jgi:predicted RNA-binding Zn-ribbon protein involved in translation (DUF1610 family)
MNTKPFPAHPFLGKILVVSFLGSIGILLGVLAILFIKPQGTLVGLAIILAASTAEVVFILRAMLQAPCPTCGRPLTRDKTSGAFPCDRCQTAWTLPPQGR